MAGMLDLLKSPRSLQDEERAEEQRLQFQAQDPFRAAAHAAYSGSLEAGKGLGTAVAGAMDRDPRSAPVKQQAAVEAAKAQVAQLGFDPEDPKSIDSFYKQVIQILQKQGLAAEALAVAKEWNAKKHTDSKDALALEESKRKAAKDKGDYEVGMARVAALTGKLGAAKASPVGKILHDMDVDKNPQNREHYMRALTNLLGSKWKAVDLGNRVEIRDAISNEVLDTAEKGAVPMNEKQTKAEDDTNKQMKTGYESAYLKAQADYDAAVDLYNHPSLEGAVGPIDSIIADTNPAERGVGTRLYAALKPSGDRQAAALIQTVKAGAFLTGFQEIKTASQAAGAKGAGFGALSDAEGARIQAAKASLDAVQDAGTFRVELAKYIRQMVASWRVISEGAKQVGITPKLLNERPLTGPTKRGKAPRNAPAPAPAAGDRVRVRMPDGRTGSVPRSQLEEAKAKGAVEIQ